MSADTQWGIRPEYDTSTYEQWPAQQESDDEWMQMMEQYPNGAQSVDTVIINNTSGHPLGSVRSPKTAPPHQALPSFYQVATRRISPSTTRDQEQSGALPLPPTNSNAYPAGRSSPIGGSSYTAANTFRPAVYENLPPQAPNNNAFDDTPAGLWQQSVIQPSQFDFPTSEQYLRVAHHRTIATDPSDFRDTSAQPQLDVYHSAASSVPSLPPREHPYNPLSFDKLAFMAQSETMQATVSPVSAHHSLNGDPMVLGEVQPGNRKRSHSVMSDSRLAQNIAQNLSEMANGHTDHQHELQHEHQHELPHEHQHQHEPHLEHQHQHEHQHEHQYEQHHEHQQPQDQPYSADQQQLHDQQYAQDQQIPQVYDHPQEQPYPTEPLNQHPDQEYQPDPQAEHQQEHRRSYSVASGGAGSQAEDYSPRGSRAFKRGDPPRNDANKYICNYSEECIGLTFDRKCEWSKHMDKHDRPYRCPHASCAKLQGFTYSGGLLRHEREVHGKHGGPKSALMCPFTDCKRHTGKGFTRKENLNEHLRRVHNGKEPHESQNPVLHELTEAAAGAQQDENTQASRLSETATAATEHDAFTMNSPNAKKRKLSLSAIGGELSYEDVEAMRSELKRLEAENSRKEEIIRQMGEEAAVRDERLRALEEVVNRMHNGQQV